MSAAQLTLDLGLILPIVSPAQFKIAFVLRTQATERTAERPPRAQMSHRGLARATGLGENTVLRALRGFDKSVLAPVEGTGGPASETSYDLHFAGRRAQDGGAAKMAAEGAAKMEAPPNAKRPENEGAAKMEAPRATENQHVTAAPPAAPPHDIADGQDVDTRARASIDVFSSLGFDSTNRIEADPIQNLPVKENQSQNQPCAPAPEWTRGDKRRGKDPEQVQAVEQMLMAGFGTPLALEPLGIGGDDAAGWLLESRLGVHQIGAVLYKVSKRIFDVHTGEPKYRDIEHPWRYIVATFNQIVAAERKPMQRETGQAEPARVGARPMRASGGASG